MDQAHQGSLHSQPPTRRTTQTGLKPQHLDFALRSLSSPFESLFRMSRASDRPMAVSTAAGCSRTRAHASARHAERPSPRHGRKPEPDRTPPDGAPAFRSTAVNEAELSGFSAACAETLAASPGSSGTGFRFSSQRSPSPGIFRGTVYRPPCQRHRRQRGGLVRVKRALRFAGAYKRAAVPSNARGETSSTPARIRVSFLNTRRNHDSAGARWGRASGWQPCSNAVSRVLFFPFPDENFALGAPIAFLRRS